MTRAMREIQMEGHRLVTVKILGAIEAGEWRSVANLADQLRNLAERGLYHDSQERAKNMASFAMANHQEQEPR